MFVKFSRFDTRKARHNPNQIVLNVVDDAGAPPVVPKACPRVTSGGQSPASGAAAFSESREPPLSGVADMVRIQRIRIRGLEIRGFRFEVLASEAVEVLWAKLVHVRGCIEPKERCKKGGET
jgi:hypothetical protein